MSKIVLIAVGAGAYVLGAKAGRERYEQISDFAQRWWNDPRVQKKRSEATETLQEKAPEGKKKLSGAAKRSAEKAKSRRGDHASTDDASTDHTRTDAAARGTSTSGATSSA